MHAQDPNRCPRQGTNGWPTGLVRLVLEWSCRASTGLPPPPQKKNLTGALTGHYVVRRRRTCKERSGSGEGMCDHAGFSYRRLEASWSTHWRAMKPLAFHIVSTEPSAAPTEGQQSQWSNHVGVTAVDEQQGQQLEQTVLVYYWIHSTIYLYSRTVDCTSSTVYTAWYSTPSRWNRLGPGA